ncbi:uncharacterized protein [Prorops nasuta]|uniref:uncharacterized protein isoform X2 n=1 Tax=Prorops nasuta TaxID=863751 RepID=UPI0034CE7435
MDFNNFEQKSYYNINRLQLKIIGSWPFDDTKISFIRRSFIQLILVSSLSVQVSKLIEDRDMDKLLENIPLITATLVLMVISMLLSKEKNAEMWTLIKEDWQQEINEEEKKLKEYYARLGYYITNIITSIFVTALVSFALVTTFYSKIFDVLIPLNESRQRIIPFEGKYFFNRDDYFYFVMFHIAVILLSGLLFLLTHLNLFFVNMLHVAGMFTVLGHRLDHGLPFDNSVKDPEKIKQLTHYMVLCIKRHQIALRSYILALPVYD